MQRLISFGSALFLLVLAVCAPFDVSAQSLDMDLFESMKPRNIGPAGMSGRVTAIDAVDTDPDVIYAGTASGGLWKSTSGGIMWDPIFDDQPTHSIGAVAIFQNNPDVVWVGAGEGNPRNSQSAGNGVYRSVDGGESWTHLGLEASRNIHRIVLDPRDSNVALIGVQGPAWGETAERGVFRTTDGGKTLEKVLFVDEKTGIGDLVMDPSNPDHILAAMWEFRRWPWFFKSGGEGSGLYETWDGGVTWNEITSEDGLPKGELGRIGLAFSTNEPEIVYALVEAKKNALYRSENGGRKWKMVNDDDDVNGRPFYYGEIYVDPENENRVYKIETYIHVSEDGGRSFTQWQPGYQANGVHPDHHAFWVSALDPSFIIEGNDGGMSITRDKGKTWRFVENLPLAQFYHINADNEFPYNVMGGMQDNGSWIGPAYVWRAGGIRNSYWQEVAFGDGFDVSPDPDDSRYGYAMSQGGSISRYDKETGNSSSIKPLHPDPDVFLRFNWDAAFEQSAHDASTIYYGSQFLHRSTNKGQSWEVISPDLTTNDPEKQKQMISGGLTYDATQAENHTTIVSIGESPVDAKVLWVGTDDGNVQLSRDAGATWTEVGKGMKGVASKSWIHQIHPSPYSAAEAVVVIDDHRQNNWEPYVYRTKDYGKTWARIADGSDVEGFALSYVQDPVSPNLAFLGTEFGLYVTVDNAKTWSKWTQGYPTASTMDMAIQEREADLAIATFGRSAWILDDIRPLREVAAQGIGVLSEPVHAFSNPVAYQASTIQAEGTRFRADAIYAGENRSNGGAVINYSVNPDAYVAASKDEKEQEEETDSDSDATSSDKDSDSDATSSDKDADKKEKAPDKVKIEILEGGEVIRTFDGPAKKGLNRTGWSMTRKGVRGPSRRAARATDSEPSGAPVLPGTYSVRITYGASVTESTVVVESDPRYEVDLDAAKARLALYAEYEKLSAGAAAMMDRIRDAKAVVARVNASLGDRKDDLAKDLKKNGKAISDSLSAFEDRFYGEQGKQGIYRDPNTVSSIFGRAGGQIFSSDRMPNTPEEWAMAQGKKALMEMLADVNGFLSMDWVVYKEAVEASDAFRIDDIDMVAIEIE